MADITMPQLGETVTEGTITRWAKQVGDKIEEDEVLFEVSTDKVDSEVPSPVSGYLTEILVQEGETADVGAKLAVIGDQASGDGSGAAQEKTEQPAAEPEPEPSVAANGSAAEPAPVAAEEQEAAAEEPEAQPEPERRPVPAEAAAGGGATQARVLSPVVRKLLNEHGLSADEIAATGSGGRITRADVLAHIDRGSGGGRPAPAPPARPPAPAPSPAAAGNGSAAAGPRGDEVVPFTNIRRRTAEHMRRSLDTSAHTLVVVEVDYDGVDKARQPARARFKEEEGFGLSYLPFVARAVIDAIHDFPLVNSSVGDNELIVHHSVNLGIAVDLNLEGLIVPVVHGADDMRLRALARRIAELATRARSKKLAADEIQGGTFTITNPGGYGTFLTSPIISQPQVAILSTDGVKPKPVAVALPGGGYGVAVHPVGNLAIAFDHRAIDGAYASAFLARAREVLETRDWGQELA
ncbi:MAG TPA: dihydrolipoamide acetyltransferase family protein [Acidimicrobiales bacterium]|nr:dihydrolipoamide acetyltransferase family protein [Acidimicrobiales bacterium]